MSIHRFTEELKRLQAASLYVDTVFFTTLLSTPETNTYTHNYLTGIWSGVDFKERMESIVVSFDTHTRNVDLDDVEHLTLVCQCLDSVIGVCQHMLAVIRHIYSQQGKEVSFWTNEEEAKRQRRKMVRMNHNFWITTRKAS